MKKLLTLLLINSSLLFCLLSKASATACASSSSSVSSSDPTLTAYEKYVDDHNKITTAHAYLENDQGIIKELAAIVCSYIIPSPNTDLISYEQWQKNNKKLLYIASKYKISESDFDKIKDLVLAREVDVNVKSPITDWTSLTFAVVSNPPHKEMVRLLLSAKADVNVKNRHGEPLFIMACQHGNEEIVKLLLDSDADFNEKDRNGYSALMWACMFGHKDIVALLIKVGANIEEKDNEQGYNALMVSSERGFKDILNLLLRAKADMNARSNNERTSLSIAFNQGHQEIAEILLKAGAS